MIWSCDADVFVVPEKKQDEILGKLVEQQEEQQKLIDEQKQILEELKQHKEEHIVSVLEEIKNH